MFYMQLDTDINILYKNAIRNHLGDGRRNRINPLAEEKGDITSRGMNIARRWRKRIHLSLRKKRGKSGGGGGGGGWKSLGGVLR